MGEIISHPRVAELSWALYTRLQPILAKMPDCYWINTPEGDLGGEWCGPCGRIKVRHLRRHERRRKFREDYFLDGGWRTDDDHANFCAACGVRLDSSLTLYGAASEVEHYLMYGVFPGRAEEAVSIYEMLNALEATDEKDAHLAEAAADIAEAFMECCN